MKNTKKTRIFIVMTLGFLMGPTALAKDPSRSPALGATGEKQWNRLGQGASYCEANRDKYVPSGTRSQGSRQSGTGTSKAGVLE